VIDPPLLACIQVLMFSRLFRHTGSGSLREEAVEGSLSWRHRRDHLARGHSRVFSIGGVWWRYSWLHGSGSRVKRETVERGPLLPVSWSFVLPFTIYVHKYRSIQKSIKNIITESLRKAIFFLLEKLLFSSPFLIHTNRRIHVCLLKVYEVSVL